MPSRFEAHGSSLEIKLPRSFRTHRIVWDFENGNFAALNNSLRQAPFHLAYELSDNVSDVISFWFELYKPTIKKFIPHKRLLNPMSSLG